MVLKTARHLKH